MFSHLPTGSLIKFLFVNPYNEVVKEEDFLFKHF